MNVVYIVMATVLISFIAGDLIAAEEYPVSEPVGALCYEGTDNILKVAPLPGRDFVNHMGMVMSWIERGSFLMGTSPEYVNHKPNQTPLHEAIIRNGFWICNMEVSQKLFQRILSLNPSAYKDPDSPVSSVRHEEAMEFCSRLNELEGNYGTLPSGFLYNLPTEVQWEYAARTDSSGKDTLSEFQQSSGGWNSETILFDGSRQSIHQQKAGTSKPDSRGLYDMCGNLWEWCLDNYHPNYGGAANDERPWLGEEYANEKVIRGGAYLSLPSECTPVKRSSRSPSRESQTQGFRVVLSVSSLYALPGSDHVTHGGSGASGTQSSHEVSNFSGPLMSAEGKLTLEEQNSAAAKEPVNIQPATISINSIGMRMVWIPKGKVDDGTDLTGAISEGFWMGTCEVTQKEYEKIMGENPSVFKNDERPVDSVSFGDAQRFCKALAERENKSYRLPSSLEWKHALYANGSSLFYGDLKDIGWIKGQSGSRISTKPVGSKNGNGYGLFDMIGNVSEWTDSILLGVKGFDQASRKVPGFICSGADMEELMKKTKSGCSVNTKTGDVKSSMFTRSNPGDKDKFTGFRVIYQ